MPDVACCFGSEMTKSHGHGIHDAGTGLDVCSMNYHAEDNL
jgi:hypothetical protein